jgi:hypothetical protein
MATPMVTPATIRPYWVKAQKGMGRPRRAARPRTTTLADAPTAVAWPPRSAPSARAHYSTCEEPAASLA